MLVYGARFLAKYPVYTVGVRGKVGSGSRTRQASPQGQADRRECSVRRHDTRIAGGDGQLSRHPLFLFYGGGTKSQKKIRLLLLYLTQTRPRQQRQQHSLCGLSQPMTVVI